MARISAEGHALGVPRPAEYGKFWNRSIVPSLWKNPPARKFLRAACDLAIACAGRTPDASPTRCAVWQGCGSRSPRPTSFVTRPSGAIVESGGSIENGTAVDRHFPGSTLLYEN